ncbi:uncharacterized protein LOC100181958 [Ciona intestinalis]
MAGARTPEYTYRTLKEVHENYQSYNQCNVYGVISDCFPVRKSRGKDYFCILRIIDESYSNGEGIKVSLFAPLAHSLPEVDQWDIIRLHRLKPSTYLGDLTFLSTKGWSFVMWPHNEDVNNGKSVSENCTIHESDKERVRELRKWISKSKVGPSKNVSVSQTIQITDIKMDAYFNVKCQVVGMAYIKDSLTIIKVWDGTSPPNNISPIPCEDVEMVHLPTLPQISHLCIDMCVYDNHVDTLTQLNIVPGSHIMITNLHAQQKSTAPLHIELYLHGGVVHNRGITLLDTGDQLNGDLQSALGKFTNVQNPSKPPHPSSGTTNTTSTSSSSGSSSLSVDVSPVQLKKVEMMKPKQQQQERKYDELEPPVIPPTPPKVVPPPRGPPSSSRGKRSPITKSGEDSKQSRFFGGSSRSSDGGVTPGSSKGQGSYKVQGPSTIEIKQNVGNSKIGGATNPPNDFVGISLERNISLLDDNDSCEIEVSNVRSLCDVTEKRKSSISNKNKRTETSGKKISQNSSKNVEFKEPTQVAPKARGSVVKSPLRRSPRQRGSQAVGVGCHGETVKQNLSAPQTVTRLQKLQQEVQQKKLQQQNQEKLISNRQKDTPPPRPSRETSYTVRDLTKRKKTEQKLEKVFPEKMKSRPHPGKYGVKTRPYKDLIRPLIFGERPQLFDETHLEDFVKFVSKRSLRSQHDSATVITGDDSSLSITRLSEIKSFNLPPKTFKYFRVRCKVKKISNFDSLVCHLCPANNIRFRGPFDSSNIEISEETSNYLSSRRRKRANTPSKTDYDITSDKQRRLPVGSSRNLSMTVTSHNEPHDGSKWESLTMDECVMRIRRKDDDKFTILYVPGGNHDTDDLVGKYDRIIHIVPKHILQSTSIPHVVEQDGMFYYCTPSLTPDPRVPPLPHEASHFTSTPPTEAMHCPTMPIVFHIDITMVDETDTCNATLWGNHASDFLNGITPEQFVKDDSDCRDDVVNRLRHLIGDVTDDERGEAPWCEFVVKKSRRVSKQGVPGDVYEIVNTRLR